MAQLVAHHTGSVGVRGSNPLSSTIMKSRDIVPKTVLETFAICGGCVVPTQHLRRVHALRGPIGSTLFTVNLGVVGLLVLALGYMTA